MTFSAAASKYFLNLKQPAITGSGIELMNPYESEKVKKVVSQFFYKYYNDSNERLFMLGINPGRFGGGLTGIAFTDPVALRESCGIDNDFGNKKELSSRFIYEMINASGGPAKFFSKIFLTALYPFAITKNGKNYNYYDDKILAASLKKDIISNVKKQIAFGARRDKAVLLGKKNAEYFIPINKEYEFFDEIIVLEHPRYIMQYKLKSLQMYIQKYRKITGK